MRRPHVGPKPSGHGYRRLGGTRFARVGAVVFAGAMVVAGCTSSGSDAKDEVGTTRRPATTAAKSSLAASTAAWRPPVCDRAAAPAPDAKPVTGAPHDLDVTSFDGTTIRAHWFPLSDTGAKSAPTVLMGPGWGSGGDTNDKPDAKAAIQSVFTIAGLHKSGYNVLTWDPRGFGESTGTVEIDSVDYEAKDVSRLLDWVAAQKGVQLDRNGDPRVGMVGGSYGGGIQFVTAASDCRVDAITPMIAWNSLASSLYKAEIVKAGWANVLVGVAATATLDPHVLSANEAAKTTGTLNQADREWFVDRGPDDLLTDIEIPTLIIQGTVDNLFPLSEGTQNFTSLAQNGIPLSMMWFCGGHGVCLNKADPATYVHDAVLHWLDRYVKRDSSGGEIPAFQTVDQNGRVHTYTSYPPPVADTPVYSQVNTGTLDLARTKGTPVEPSSGDVIGGVSASITPTKATTALEVPVTVTGSGRMLLGAPDLRLGYRCDLDAPATKPTRIFAQIVDDASGRVLGNQVTPILTICDGLLHESQSQLEVVAFDAKPGAKLTLQLIATTPAYAVPQLGGTVDFARVELTIPTVAH